MKIPYDSEEYKSFEFNVIPDPLDRIENWVANCGLKINQSIDEMDKLKFTKYCRRKVRLENFKEKYINKIHKTTIKFVNGGEIKVIDKENENGVKYKMVYQEFEPQDGELVEVNSPINLQIGDKNFDGYVIDSEEYESVLFAIDKIGFDIFLTASNKMSDIYGEWFRYTHGTKYDFNNQIIWINSRYNEQQVEYFWEVVNKHFMEDEK